VLKPPLTTRPPKDYAGTNWEFRLNRLDTCLECEYHFMGNISKLKEREWPTMIVCGACGCSAYQKSADLNETTNPCPKDKWVMWKDWNNK